MSSRVILVTGGSGKFGRTLVSCFLEKGDAVLFTARSQESIASVLGAHPAAGARLAGIQADFTGEDAVARLTDALAERDLWPDGLVNNARCLNFLETGRGGVVSRTNFLGEFLVDVVAPYELTMALALHPKSRLKRVVNISSQYGMVAANPALYTDPVRQSPLHYGVAKAALAHLTRELAVRLADRNVQVNCVAFGGVEGRVDDAFKKRYAALVPMRRMLRDDEVAGPVNYLLSEECSGMTGHVMAVDGGWSIW
jgi:NAD(P)-dependent dehydrogenase (short-subunit alcohol dehydrogenase family)